MLRTNPFATRSTKEDTSDCFMESLRRSSPPLSLAPRPMTPPVFPRSRMPGGGREVSLLPPSTNTMKAPSLFTPSLKVHNDDDGDTELDQMVIIDGWQAYAIPSTPPTPSLADSSSDIDELFLPSPASKSLPIQEFLHMKMEEHIMPRISTIGGDRPKAKLLSEGRSLREHLHPFIKSIEVSAPASPPSLHERMPSSVLGQPSAMLDDSFEVPPPMDDLDDGIMKLLAHVQEDDTDLILRECPDDKISELMEVPHLPEPCEHGPSAITPTSLQTLLAKPHPDANIQQDSFSFLKPVTGVKPLNIELSWRPFDFEDKVPTHDEIAQTAGLHEMFSSNTQGHVDEVEITRILRECHPPELPLSSIILESERLRHFMDKSPAAIIHEPEHHLHNRIDAGMILTRKERRRAARIGGYPDNFQDGEDDGPFSQASRELDTKRRKVLSELPFSASPPAPLLPVQHLTRHEVSQSPGHGATSSHPTSTDDSFNTIPVADYSSREDDMDLTDSQIPLIDHGADRLSMNPARRYTPHLPVGQVVDPVEHDSRLNAWSPDLPASSVPSPSQSPEPTSPLIKALPQEHEKRHSVNCSLYDWMILRPNAPLVNKQDSSPDLPSNQTHNPPQQNTTEVPAELVDSHTLREPSLYCSRPDIQHSYLASLDTLKDRPLVRSLRSPQRRVNLIERDSLKDVDLILDCDTAVILFPLHALPAHIGDFKTRLDASSWRYLRILVVFQTYTSSAPGSSNELSPQAFTAPVIKAVKKLHREIALSDAYETKRAEAKIQYAFAMSADHAADFILTAAEAARRRGTDVWGSREWLDEEEQEDEQNLAAAVGMNTFVAALILSRVSLNNFLDMDPAVRMKEFGCLVGEQRILHLNEWLSLRKSFIDSSSDGDIPM
ncbi:hypothetical protein OF83DRAFT_8425 [Amylostereum chailletii]|nr:hypothetical protein OF83DRAFT_8425 [Amylostereum chailletii]